MNIPPEIFAALNLTSPDARRNAEDYLREVVVGAAGLMNVEMVLISMLSEGAGDTFETLVLVRDGVLQPNIDYKRAGTPCENVYTDTLCCYEHSVALQFPEDLYLQQMGAESYLGTPLLDSRGRTIGILACIDTKPILQDARALKIAVLRILALNIEAHIERMLSDRMLMQAWRDLNFKSAALDQHCLVSITDKNGDLVYVNENLCKITGWTRGELLSQPHRTLMPMHHTEDYIQHAWNKLRAGEIWRSIVHNKTKCGDDYWIDASYIPQMSEYGELERFIGVRTDITAMINALDEAQASARAKSAFLSAVSHELRTPLNAVLGYIQLLKLNTSLDPDQEAYINIISENSARLLDQIKTLLSYAESQHLVQDSQVQPVDIRALVEEILSVFTPMAREYGVKLQNEVMPGFSISSQPAFLRSILENLISNSIKYNHRDGYVIVTSESYLDRCKLIVQDNGIGIGPDLGDKIFNRFERGPAQGGVVPGSGLGLTIVHDLVAQMGGKISYVSTLGKGTSFTVEC